MRVGNIKPQVVPFVFLSCWSVYLLPKQLDEQVAKKHLPALSAVITVLTVPTAWLDPQTVETYTLEVDCRRQHVWFHT